MRVSGSLVARNAGINLVGRVLPLIVAVLSIPYAVRQLGPDRFGILSLAWVITGYFALFDLGIGSAVTKFVAELLARGENGKLPALIWTAVVSQLCLGTVAGALLAAGTPVLVEHVLKIPAGVQPQARSVFLILAAFLPISFVTGSLGGVLAASQRFDLLNAVGVPSSALSYLLPVVALALGFGLPGIAVFLVVARLASLVVTYYLCLHLHPSLNARSPFDWRLLKTLLGFGGWVTVSGVVGPALLYFDRVLIGSLISIAAVGFYTPPSMITARLGLVSGSLTAALFPAFSAYAGSGDREWIERALARSVKYLLLVVGPIALGLIFLAHPILALWLGAEFAAKGTLVMQILAIGLLVNSLASVPYSLVQGVGRPDLTAKFHLVELPIHVVVVWLLVSAFGLPGAALAWTIRVVIDFALLFGACFRLRVVSLRAFAQARTGNGAVLLGLLAGSLLLVSLSGGWDTRTTLAGIALALFCVGSWRFVLDDHDRRALVLALRSISPSTPALRS